MAVEPSNDKSHESDVKHEHEPKGEHEPKREHESDVEHEHDVWDDVFDAVHDPTPEINEISRRRFLNSMRKLRSHSSAPLVIDTAVRFSIAVF